MSSLDVMQRFSPDFGTVLSKDEIRRVCPVVFETIPTNPGLSSQYVQVNSETIMDDLGRLGWVPVSAVQRKNRVKDGKSKYSFHMVSYQHPEIMINQENGGIEGFPRIIMTNSHDGTSAFKFMVGLYRLVCSNGLVISTEEFSNFKIRHLGYSFEELRKVVEQMVIDLPTRVAILNQMRERQLIQDEREELAQKALLIRSGIELDSEEAKGRRYDGETILDLLTPIRPEDSGSSLWTTFNILQEKVIKGGFEAALAIDGKVRKVRPITSFEKDLKINKELFQVASSMLVA